MRVFIAALLLTGCQLGQAEPHWSDQLSAEGPCWDVNLLDGLDETSTDEMHALFACLNRTGNLEALSRIDGVLDVSTRRNVPLGLTVAELMNLLPKSGYDVFGFAGKALQALQQNAIEATLAMEMFVEALYGRPYETTATSVNLMDPEALDQGIVRPAIPLLAVISTQILDTGESIPNLAVSILESDRMNQSACTVAGLFRSDDPKISAIGARLMPNIGDALDRMNNPDNDLWLNASGNSLHDFVGTMLLETGADGRTGLETISEELLVLMKDSRIQSRTRTAIALADARGDLVEIPAQLVHLANVDVWGAPLIRGSAIPSALLVGLRMLHRGNTELVCTIPIINVGINLGNLSQQIVRIMAESNLTDIEDVLDLLSQVLAADVTSAIVEEIAAGGYCDPIDDQFLDDLTILDRLKDPELAALVPVMMDMLDVVYAPGEIDQVPALVDLLSAFYDKDLIDPFSELLRDLAGAPLTEDMTNLAGVVVDPHKLLVEACPTDSEPLDFDDVWEIAVTSMEPDQNALSAVQTLTPLIAVIVDHSATWTTLDNTARLLQAETSKIQQLPELFVDALALAEDTEISGTLVDLLNDPTLRVRVLSVLESEALGGAVAEADLQLEGPLPFAARLVTSEAVTVMLQTIDLILDTIGVSESDSSVAE